MNDSQLDHLLKSCGSCHVPPGFQADVWNRIAAEPDPTGMLSTAKRLVLETLDRLSQPFGAIATCAAFMIAGGLIGLASRPESPPSKVQYIQSVSPFIHKTGR